MSATSPPAMLDRRYANWAVRAALVLVFMAFGYVKFFPFEAESVAPLIAAHPFLSWLSPFGQQFGSRFLGVVEIAAGLLLAAHFVSPRLGVVGGLLAVATFAITVSLLLFLPGVWEASAGGFPAISGTGGFLLKDAVLFAASYLCLVESVEALQAGRETVRLRAANA